VSDVSDPALSLRDVRVRLGARDVLCGVSLDLAAGSVHALVGENGAGKTTLIRVACGLLGADRGELRAGARALPPGDALAAARAGVGVVHQHFMLVDTLSVIDNVALGAEPRRGPLGLLVDRAAVRRRVAELCAEHGLPVDPDASVGALPVGVRQRVEIVKVLFRGARVLLLDEPTAVLSPGEVRGLLDTVRALAQGGAAVLFVSHKLDEVFAVADHITVLHRGAVTLSRPRASLTPEEVAQAVVGGAAVPELTARAGGARGEVALAVEDLSAPGLRGVSLAVRAGEVLGVAGVEGNGQRPLAEVIAGVLAPTAGRVRVGGAEVTRASVRDRRLAGLRWVPEDRERRGLLPDLTVAENVCLGDPRLAAGRAGFHRGDAEALARNVIERFDVRPREVSARMGDLSGGNQQKVLMGRELLTPPVALVVAQPTRGVDLGASARIREALREARDAGAAVLLISSELDELRALSDRVVVLRGGAVAAEMSVEEATDDALGAAMLGGVG
jgi:ABC-type uncharacterized transport system ATPase subunit